MIKRLKISSYLIYSFLLLIVTSCKTTDIQIVKQYYKAYNSKDYDKLRLLTSSDIKVYELGNVVVENQDSFIDIVKMGEVFNSENRLKKITTSNNKVVAEEYEISDKITFLNGEAIYTQVTYLIEKQKITELRVEYLAINLEKEHKNREAFFAWVSANHPSSMDKITDLTEEGALIFKKEMLAYKDSLKNSENIYIPANYELHLKNDTLSLCDSVSKKGLVAVKVEFKNHTIKDMNIIDIRIKEYRHFSKIKDSILGKKLRKQLKNKLEIRSIRNNNIAFPYYQVVTVPFNLEKCD